jgi:hypothetical protein
LIGRCWRRRVLRSRSGMKAEHQEEKSSGPS